MELFNVKVLLPKEEMHKSNQEQKNSESKNSLDLKNSLVFSIDQNDKLIKFNKECEKILGFNKKEILNKQFFNILIPDKYLKKWKNTIKLVRKNKLKDDFKLPLLSKNSEKIMILWSNFPVKDTKGIVKDIGFVGKMVPSKIKENERPTKDSQIEMKKTEKNIDDNNLIKDLVEKNLELENKNKELEKELETLQDKLTQDTKKEEEPEVKAEPPSGKFEHSFSKLIGGKKKRIKIEKMTNDLEEKRILLNERENQLVNEKRSINEKINEFCKWREKLELLENELYRREEKLKEKEELLNKDTKVESIDVSSPVSPTVVTTEDIIDNSDFLNKISESAVVLKRGILKQINDPFVKLIGYTNEEIIEKSIFNFIAPEGFQGAETYYFSRIKGENISTYETTFLTKDNSKINVEISYRPTTFNGEKAEIAIIKKLVKEDEKLVKEDENLVEEGENLVEEDKKLAKEDVKLIKEDVKLIKEDEKLEENNK